MLEVVIHRAAALLPLLLVACAAPAGRHDPLRADWIALPSPTRAGLRGLSVVSADVVWCSGADGTVLRSVDGGRTWVETRVDEAEEADLRSIHAFDATSAVAATAGRPARVLRTDDGGGSWRIVHEEEDARAFLDSVRFADERRGWIFGDPLDRRGHFVLETDDGGRTWRRAADTPPPVDGEAGFAASGTCIAVVGPHVRIGTGGARARVLRTDDGGRTWSAAATPLAQGAASQGVFSVAFADVLIGVAVGGDYLDPERRDGTAAFTVDGGSTWLAAEVPPAGFRSCVAIAPRFGPGVRFAVGTTGADISRDGGRTWRPVPGGIARAHHAIAFAPDAPVGFAVGADGRISRIDAR